MKLFAGCLCLSLAAVTQADTLTFDQPLTGWTVDRRAPGVFEINNSQFPGNNVLQLGVVGSQRELSSNFYNYQGMQHAFPLTGSPQSYSIDQFVSPSDWGADTINSGIWGVGYESPAVDPSAYPIVAYRQGGADAAGYYSFDYINGGWTFLTAANAGWNNLRLELTPGTGIQYFVNGVAVGATADSATANLTNVILNSYNNGKDYSVFYDNLTTESGAAVAAVPLPGAAMAGLTLLGGCAIGRRRRRA